jgi:hypothetical protein
LNSPHTVSLHRPVNVEPRYHTGQRDYLSASRT